MRALIEREHRKIDEANRKSDLSAKEKGTKTEATEGNEAIQTKTNQDDEKTLDPKL